MQCTSIIFSIILHAYLNFKQAQSGTFSWTRLTWMYQDLTAIMKNSAEKQFKFSTTKMIIYLPCSHGSKLHGKVKPYNWKYGKVQKLLKRSAWFMASFKHATKLSFCLFLKVLSNGSKLHDNVQMLLKRATLFMTRLNLAIENMARFRIS